MFQFQEDNMKLKFQFKYLKGKIPSTHKNMLALQIERTQVWYHYLCYFGTQTRMQEYYESDNKSWMPIYIKRIG